MQVEILIALLMILSASLVGCGGNKVNTQQASTRETSHSSEKTNENITPTQEEDNRIMKMTVSIGNQSFVANLEDNDATRELVQMMKVGPVTISMNDYSGLEKVGSLGRSLTTSNKQTTTQAGDIVLYNGNQIVIFYGSNSWSYTRIGKIDDLTGWEDALGSGDVSVTFSVD